MRKVVVEILKLIYKNIKVSSAKREVSKKFKLPKLITNIQIMNELSPNEREKYGRYFITKPMRTGSGVAPVAIMTKPCQCPHVKKGIGPCLMCPGGPGSVFGEVPQSYTGKEPASMRAIRANFDPYLQVFNRLEQYIVIGQIPGKVELIIMGGTFPSTPKSYQETFVKYTFKAMNDFSRLFFINGKLNYTKFKNFFELPGDVKDPKRVSNVVEKIKKLKKECNLITEQKKNEKAMIRCIGLVIETRPDYSGRKEANLMLKLGCTRVELGVQSVFDDVLNNINRGHGVKEIIESTKLLKDFGFKVTYHYMLGLPGSNREKDVQGFKLLFGSQDFQPDMLKIYPCVVTRGTKLFEDYKKGKYKPLDVKETAEIISELKKYVPSYVRIMRIQRDIPSIQIEAGPDRTNLRQYVQAIMTKKGIKCKCIRCMETDEVGEKYNIFINSYLASCGREYFISSENQNGLFGFCRLRFPFSRLRKEITRESALIRELHVYGDIVNVGGKAKVQHRGIGKRLLEVSEEIAKHNGIKKMIIISGIGVRDYYKNLGYKLEGSYMIKKL